MGIFFRQVLNIDFLFLKKVTIFTFTVLLSSCVDTRNYSLPNAVSILSGEKKIIISSPEGFCVDQKLSSKTKSSITLFVIDCVNVDSSLGFNNLRRPLSAILTATVIDLEVIDIDGIERLRELFIQKPGINVLSRGNTSALLKVHEVESERDLLLFLIEQRPPDIDVKQSDYFWRGFFFLNKRIISMTASNFSDDYYSKTKLKNLIREFANNTLLANKSIE